MDKQIQKVLIDTNIFLEVLFDQENSDLASKILTSELKKYVTNFTLNSLCIIAKNKRKPLSYITKLLNKVYDDFSVIDLKNNDLFEVYKIAELKELDFDDAHIYYLAKKNKLKVITFDKHLLKFPTVTLNLTNSML